MSFRRKRIKSKNNVGEKALKAGIGYTIGNILVKGISFLSIPIIARLVTVTDYGIYNTFSSYVSILSVIIGFALHASIKNANIDYKEKINEYCSSISLLILFNTVFLMVISLIGKRVVSSSLSLEHDYFAVLIVIEMKICVPFGKKFKKMLRYKKNVNMSCLKSVFYGNSVSYKILNLPGSVYSKIKGSSYFWEKLDSYPKFKWESSEFVGILRWENYIYRNYYQEFIKKEFEDIMICVPKTYNEILEESYGDYMKYPPEEFHTMVIELIKKKIKIL